jgi:kumamolisin
MNRFEEFEILPGSERDILPAAEVGKTASDFPLTVTLHLKRKLALNFEHTVVNKHFLTRQRLEDEHGAAFNDMKTVVEFLEKYGLTILYTNMCNRIIVAAGTAAAMSSAFKVGLVDRLYGRKLVRSRSGPIYLPKELVDVVTGVFGLDNRPQAKSHRLAKARPNLFGIKPDAFDGNQLAAIYNFPSATGQGQTIGIIELGGGFLQSDITAYFAALKLPAPAVKAVSVGGGANSPGVDVDADTEVALDIQVAGAVAPGANIVVYFAPNTDQGFLQAILAALHDEENDPKIISISWGGAESTWTAQQMTAMDEAMQSAAAIGVTALVAAGDDGADDNVGDGAAHVDFPASSPSVTACGGTSLVVADGVRQESVWNDGDGSATGGGISNVFARPVYQQSLAMPSNLSSQLQGRGLPDVAAVADPDTGYAVLVDGSWQIVGGTSAVAPLIAGLMARLNQLTGKPSGLINTALYKAQSANGFNDIVGGNNSCDGVVGYLAVKGWDPVTGWGSPNGTILEKLLGG